jgi:NAD-dependent dihydropyrimidine dehydrogenase PreA subunit
MTIERSPTTGGFHQLVAADRRFTQPWHGILREEITWHQMVNGALSRGCCLCVTGCGRNVFRYAHVGRKSVVVAPVQCTVGCTTCSNLCPERAIDVPPSSEVHPLMRRRKLLQRVKRVELADRARLTVPTGPAS